MEFYVGVGHFSGFAILENHLLLEEYENKYTEIYISSKSNKSKLIVSDIENGFKDGYKGFRGIGDYCNTSYGIEKILEEGSGLFYLGPPIGAKIIIDIFTKYEIAYNIPNNNSVNYRMSTSNGKKYKVLFLGEFYLVAEDFKIEVNET